MIYPFSFEGEIVNHDVGTYRYTVIFLPGDVAKQLPFAEHPRLRVTGEVAEVPFSGAWQPVRGRWYLMLGKKLLKDAGLVLGDRAEVRFAVDDQNAVDTPSALLRALEQDAAASAAWEALSPGKRRALSHRILGARTAPTQRRRLQDVLAHLRGDIDLRIGGTPRRRAAAASTAGPGDAA